MRPDGSSHHRASSDINDKRELNRLQQRNRYARRVQQQKEDQTNKCHGKRKRNIDENLFNGVEASADVSSHGDLPMEEEPPLVLSRAHELRLARPCGFCGAMRFIYEPAGFCCAQGKIVLADPRIPDDLYELFTSDDENAAHFRAHLRAYNSIFAFTSFRVTLDQNLANSQQGVYTFRAQGQVYHSLPSLKPSDQGPCFFQLYFYDTMNEAYNRMSKVGDTPLKESTVEDLIRVMNDNPYAIFLRTLMNQNLENHVLSIRTDLNIDQRVYNAPTSDEVAAVWVEGNNPTGPFERYILVYSKTGHMYTVKHYYGCYDPLQYPLLFPFGEVGWHQNIRKKVKPPKNRPPPDPVPEFLNADDIFSTEKTGVKATPNNKVSCREYYCYKLQVRENVRSILLYSKRLLQQYIVDMYIKIESTRLDFFKKKQSRIRADLYQGLNDCVSAGEVKAAEVGKRIVLPASFVGGPRDMRRRYLDAIALVSKFGKPDFFLTMTCNPEWPEIKKLLKKGQTAQDRPDLVARVFRGKINDLKDQLFSKQLFGKVAAHVHVIEFQKRGLPHCHMLIILSKDSKITKAEEFDKFVCAEIPDPDKEPELYAKVIKHMMHGPCGNLNPNNMCMRETGCKNHYPRPFSNETVQGKDSYPLYKRRNNGRKVLVRNSYLDNRWVVPYNPYLLSRYDCHINVEICSGVKAVKYLYKYIYKGHDKAMVYISVNGEIVDIDEIAQYQDARWVAPPEAAWRIFGFNLNEIYPAVINLQLHLPNQQTVVYNDDDDLEEVLKSEKASKTTLTEFFNYCLKDPKKEQHLYGEFAENFTWDSTDRIWFPRKHKTVIGRINSASVSEGERYYLRLLLTHVRSPTSYEDLLTFNGVRSNTFKEAAVARGLLQSTDWLFDCLSDAVTFQMPKTLRHLFATILVFCEPTDVNELWERFYEDLSEDFAKQPGVSSEYCLRETLSSIDYYLESMGRSILNYSLPALERETNESTNSGGRELLDEMGVHIPALDREASKSLNEEQRAAYDVILEHVFAKNPKVFFIDGPGGTGKTFLYRALLATIRSKGYIAIATATSGVAASIMPGGRTSHSRFKIPLDGDEAGICGITKQSGTAELLRKASLIIWDEAPMAKRSDIEAVDRTLRDILSNDMLFGGKVVVLGGDFRQVLPVIPRGSRAETINASLAKSYLWPEMHKMKLTNNMRAQNDPRFSEFLLRVGDGKEPKDHNGLIDIPDSMVIHVDDEKRPEISIMNSIYADLNVYGQTSKYITERAILATRNESVDMLNEKLISRFPGKEYRYISYDKASDNTNQCYPEEFLNTLTPNGLPPHELVLKENSPIMLLRNISPSEGLCNGTRMVCRGFKTNIIHAEITVGQYSGKQVFLHRIPLHPPKNESFPFQFERMQFLIRLCFAMTINKAQGQTIPNVGIYLPQHVFSHGQLYVALSRGTSMATTKVLVPKKLKTHIKRTQDKKYCL